MSTRLALAAWLVPLAMAVLVGAFGWLDSTVRHPEPIGEPAPCYGTEDGETICPEETLPPPSRARELATALNAEWLRTLLLTLGELGGLACAGVVIARTRTSRAHDPVDRRAFRGALAALVVLLGVPLLAGGVLLFALMTYRISG